MAAMRAAKAAVRRVRPLDVAIATWVTGLTVWNIAHPSNPVFGTPIQGPGWLVVALPMLIGLPLLFRRSFPLSVWSLFMSGMVVQATLSSDAAEGLGFVVGTLAASYSVGAYATRARAIAGLGLFAVGYAAYASQIPTVGEEGWAVAFWALTAVAAWLTGIAVRSVREARRSAADLVRLEADQQAAVAAERARIARELHDIVAHSVSVIGLQAAAAQQLINGEPERVRAPLEAIEASARDSVFELRHLLDVLRDDGTRPDLSPQPCLGDLDALVEQVCLTGIDVRLNRSGRIRPLSPGLEASAYRVVQEALTNVLKHANAHRADVSLDYRERELCVHVADDGSGAINDGRGHGLIGMRERVAVYDGTLTTGVDASSGGFEVSATFRMDDGS